jgi:acetylornithine deacetylase
MSFEPRRIERIRTAFDEGEALALLRRAIAVPSVTGEEKAFAELLAQELKALGASDVTVKDFAPGRPNVSARLSAATAAARGFC